MLQCIMDDDLWFMLMYSSLSYDVWMMPMIYISICRIVLYDYNAYVNAHVMYILWGYGCFMMMK